MCKKIVFFFSIIAVCSIISGCNEKHLSDSTVDIVETVQSEEQTESSILPVDNTLSETIWSETVRVDEKSYQILFDRMGSPYEGTESDSLGLLSDYQLVVKSENEEVLQTLAMTNYPIRYENVYWIKDISQDGFPDVIFCTDFISRHRNTRLRFFIWNGQKQLYECRNLPDEYVRQPIWNEELETIMFWKEGTNAYTEDMKMYFYDKDTWKLYGEILIENDEDIPDFTNAYEEEKYYKELLYTIKEIFYENGKVIQKTILEESPWWNPDSIWYRDNEKNLELYPAEGWEEETVQLPTGETVCKYVTQEFYEEPTTYENELMLEMNTEKYNEMEGAFQAEEYLQQEIWELDDYDYYINGKSEGQAFLIVESAFHPTELYLYGEEKKFLGYYYQIYVGEQWEIHRVNWDLFYVREDFGEILEYDMIDCILYSIEDWRESLRYKNRSDMIADFRNQQKE